MQYLLKPLIINLFFIIILVILIKITFKLFKTIYTTSTNIFQYKINNIYFSIFLIGLYISIVIFGFYLLRLYNLPRNVDLKLKLHHIYIVVTNLYSFLMEYSYITVIYLIFVISLSLSIPILSVIYLHKLAYKEMHKLFLLYMAKHDRYNRNKRINFYQLFFDIALEKDLVMYFLIYLSKILGKIDNKNYNWDKIPLYNPYKLMVLLRQSGYYTIIIRISPMFFVIYDCLFNNFIITHVFYYLLFYIPLRLFTRFTNCVGNNSDYITIYLYEVLYKDEDCLYAASPTLKAILDNFVLSGFEMNFAFGVQSEAELAIIALTRFELADENGPLDKTYVNQDGQFLHTYDKIHYYHVIPDENGEPVHGVEWTIIIDKTKDTVNADINYDKK